MNANHILQTKELCYSVPEVSVLRPILIILYIQPLSNLINQHSLSVHLFADDIQIKTSILLQHVHRAISSVETCISDVKNGMIENKLQSNDEKTEYLHICPNNLDTMSYNSLILQRTLDPILQMTRELMCMYKISATKHKRPVH